MSTRFELPEWLPAEPAPTLPPVDDHRVEGLVNRFIAGKQEALFTAPNAFYRQQGGDALDGAPAIADQLQALRLATLDQARDDGERTALGPRLDLHVADALDGIDRHVAAQRMVHQRQVLAERQRLIRRAAELEPDNDDKIDGLAEAQASAAQALARLDGIAPDSPEEAEAQANARSQILRRNVRSLRQSSMSRRRKRNNALLGGTRSFAANLTRLRSRCFQTTGKRLRISNTSRGFAMPQNKPAYRWNCLHAICGRSRRSIQQSRMANTKAWANWAHKLLLPSEPRSRSTISMPKAPSTRPHPTSPTCTKQ